MSLSWRGVGYLLVAVVEDAEKNWAALPSRTLESTWESRAYRLHAAKARQWKTDTDTAARWGERRAQLSLGEEGSIPGQRV